jgi:hypothetical protein
MGVNPEINILISTVTSDQSPVASKIPISINKTPPILKNKTCRFLNQLTEATAFSSVKVINKKGKPNPKP